MKGIDIFQNYFSLFFTLNLLKREEGKKWKERRETEVANLLDLVTMQIKCCKKPAVSLFGHGFSNVSIEPVELKGLFITVHPENTCEK